MKITGLDKLTKTMANASKAFNDLYGIIATISFNPKDRLSIDAAIHQMEIAIDEKINRYRDNSIVDHTGMKLKAKYRELIRKRAADAFRQDILDDNSNR